MKSFASNVFFLVAVFGFLIPCFVTAQEKQGVDTTFYFRFDNDMLALPRSSDQNYTMGIAMRWVTTAKKGESEVDEHPLFAPLDVLTSLLPFENAKTENETSRSMILGGTAHTPKCLDTAENCAARGQPITRDRPYDNIFYTGVSRKYRIAADEAFSTEFNVGIHGTNVGRVVQTEIHELCCRNRIPQEWGTQIGHGGSPTFLYKFTKAHSLDKRKLEIDTDIEIEGKYGFWLGWNTWPTAGIAIDYKRVARIEYNASYVLFNESLQGAWFGKNTISYSYSDLERVVTLMHFQLDIFRLSHLMFGTNSTSKHGLEFGQNWKSRDLKVGGVESKHRWGTLTYSYRY